MKKILWIASFLTLFSGVSLANCLTVKFDNGDSFCVAMEKSGKTYSASITDKKLSSATNTLRCELLLPDKSLENLWACNGSFSYSSNSTEKIRLYVRYNQTYYTVINTDFDFSEWEWEDVNAWKNGSNNSSKNVSSNLEIKVNDTEVDKWDSIDLTIETDDDYEDDIDFTVQYKDGSFSDIAKRNYSTYFSDYDNILTSGIDMDGEDWYKKIRNFITFKKEWTYKIIASDNDDKTASLIVYVGGSSSSSDENDTLEITPSDTNPDKNEYIDVKIKTDSDYEGEVKFTEVEYKDSGSFKSVLGNDSYYVSSSIDDDKSVKMKGRGSVKISDFIKFKKNGTYKLGFKDEDGNSQTVKITVGTTDSNLEVSADNLTPKVKEKLTLTFKDDKNVYVYFTGYYKEKQKDKWTKISSNTSSTYFSDYSTEWKRGYYKTTTNSEKEVEDFFAFAKEGYYKITFEDENDNEADDLIFSVGDVSKYDEDKEDEEDWLTLKASTKSPKVNQYIDIDVQAKDEDYAGIVRISVRYKEKKSDDYSTIRITNSSYFDGDESKWDYNKWKAWSFNILSSNKGKEELEKLVKFKKEGYYEVTFTDKNYNSSTIVFNVWVSGSVSYDDDDDEESDVSGFTKKQLSTVKKIKTVWKAVVAEVKSESNSLKNDSYWKYLSDNIYDWLNDVINDKKNRDYDNFRDVRKAILEWISYVQLKQ